MAKYVIQVDYLTKMIFIEDRATKTMHMFTRIRNSDKPGTPLRHREYPMSDDLQIVVPTYETNMDIFGDGCSSYIQDFDTFASILKEVLGRK